MINKYPIISLILNSTFTGYVYQYILNYVMKKIIVIFLFIYCIWNKSIGTYSVTRIDGPSDPEVAKDIENFFS